MENPRTSLKKLNWKVNGRLFGFGTSPEADWKIILISTIVLAVLAIALNVLIFIKIDKREIFVADKAGEERGQALDISLLRETVLYYQNKAREFEKIQNQKTTSMVSPAGIGPASEP